MPIPCLLCPHPSMQLCWGWEGLKSMLISCWQAEKNPICLFQKEEHGELLARIFFCFFFFRCKRKHLHNCRNTNIKGILWLCSKWRHKGIHIPQQESDEKMQNVWVFVLFLVQEFTKVQFQLFQIYLEIVPQSVLDRFQKVSIKSRDTPADASTSSANTTTLVLPIVSHFLWNNNNNWWWRKKWARQWKMLRRFSRPPWLDDAFVCNSLENRPQPMKMGSLFFCTQPQSSVLKKKKHFLCPSVWK